MTGYPPKYLNDKTVWRTESCPVTVVFYLNRKGNWIMWRALVVLKIISEDKDESTFRFAHVHFIVTDN